MGLHPFLLCLPRLAAIRAFPEQVFLLFPPGHIQECAQVFCFPAAGRADTLVHGWHGVYRHGKSLLCIQVMAKCQGKKIIALSKHKPAYIDRVILELSVT